MLHFIKSKKMKYIILTLGLCFFMVLSSAQKKDDTQSKNEKHSKKELNERSLKAARTEAKKLEKDGWTVSPGSIPLDKLCENSMLKSLEADDAGNVRYITADGNGVAQSKTAAEMQAIETGKLQLAGLVASSITSLIDVQLGNAQLTPEEAASITQVIQSAKNTIAKELGYINPYFKIYRYPNKSSVEVQVRLFYDLKQSLDIAQRVVKADLKEKLKLNDEKLEKLMGIN